MKIVFLTPTLELAGGTVVLQRYVDALIRDGHSVTIISPDRGRYAGETSPAILTYTPVPLRYLDTLTFQLPYWRRVTSLIPADTEIIVPIYTPLLIPALRFKRRYPTARIVLLAQEGMEVPIIGFYNRFLFGRHRLISQLSAIVAVSKTLARQIKTIAPVTLPVITLPNGVDHAIFKRKEQTKRQSILFVGRPNATKGFPEFIHVVERLQKDFPGLRGQVVVPARYTVSHPLLDHTPNQTAAELADFYRQSLAYINLSHAESFGLPPLEAMACGTPVVLTDAVGFRQYARDGQNCLVVPIGDVTAATKAISRLLRDQNLQRHLVANGIETAAAYRWATSEQRFTRLLVNL